MFRGITESLVASLVDECPTLNLFLFGDKHRDGYYTGKCMIAGGWVVCKLADIQTSDGDIDFFFESKEEIDRFVKEIKTFYSRNRDVDLKIETSTLSHTFKLDGKKIQLITCNVGTHISLLNGFDILPCAVGIVIDIPNEDVYLIGAEGAPESIEEMELNYTPALQQQLVLYSDPKVKVPRNVYFDITYERTIKYIKRGFNLTPASAKTFNVLVRTASRQEHNGSELQKKARTTQAYTTVGTRRALYHPTIDHNEQNLFALLDEPDTNLPPVRRQNAEDIDPLAF